VRPLRRPGGLRQRAGTQILSLFSTPLNGLVLHALADGPRQLRDLREAVDWPPASTLRGNLEALAEMGAIQSRRGADRGNSVEYLLAPLGEELLGVADAIDAWLARAPGEPSGLGNGGAKVAVAALANGWDTAMIRALAARPLTLTELDRLIPSVSYPALWRRLAAMRVTGQVQPRSADALGQAYGVTDWLREALVPLALAARSELRHLHRAAAPITAVEVESAFLLTLPLVSLPEPVSGACTLVVDIGEPAGGDSRSRVAGVRVAVHDGLISSCSTRLLDRPETWALGTAEGWLDAVLDSSDAAAIACGGADPRLAVALLDGIRQALGSIDGWAVALR
jgi:DNA-binding HxlR family transcriptional regulator